MIGNGPQNVSIICNFVLVYRRFKTSLGSLAASTLKPVEPEEQFEPFECVRESCEDPASAASSCSSSVISSKSNTSKIKTSQNPIASNLAPSPARSCALLSSLSSTSSVETSGRDMGATGKLNESIETSEDKIENDETLGTQYKGVSSVGVGTLIGLRGSPQVLEGFRGGMGGRGTGGRPSPASRLCFVDRKWLERCQVFGEMGAEVKPGAGNQEIDLEKIRREMEGKIQGDERVGKEEIDTVGARREAIDLGRDEGFESITSDKIVSDSALKPALQHTGKSRGGGGEKIANKKGDEEIERGLTPPPAPEDDNETSHKSKGAKKRGRKRQREGENMGGEMTEEGGEKKRRRNAKKKEERSDENPSSAQEGGKKRRAKKKGDEDEEPEDKKETKVPKKASHFIFITAYCVLFFVQIISV